MWAQALSSHPDRPWVHALLQGMCNGFRIGLQTQPLCRASHSNMPSAAEQSPIVDNFLQQQCQAGFMLGPFPADDCMGVVTSSLGVIPKKTPGKWRVIVDLSRPEGSSVNDNTRRQHCHLAYSSVEDATLIMHSLGPGASMAKIDIRDAYRLVPIHPEDRPFLGVSWGDGIFVDCQLPFGLASAPAIFSAIAEALEWVLRQRGVRCVLHYLDDFLIFGAPHSDECAQALAITLSTCSELGIPLAHDKTEGPTTELTFLGVLLNSVSSSVSLPQDKLRMVRNLIQHFVGLRVVRDARAFESLLGHLVHVTKVCPLGKAFLNSLFAVSSSLTHGQCRRINCEARADLAWWHALLSAWVGLSVHQFLLLRSPDKHLFTDASGSWGCGAWCLPFWLQIPWPADTALPSIALKELVPIVLACAIWGPQWKGQLIMCHSDNMAVVSQVNRLHAHDPKATHMLRCLAFFQALYDCRLRAVHIPGVQNTGADDLSRGRTAAFRARFTQSSSHPSQVPQELVNLLCSCPPDWISLHWRDLFSAFWRKASPNPLGGFTLPAGGGTSLLWQPSPLKHTP